MAFSPDALRGALFGGGSRPTLFHCQVTNPYGSVAGDLKFQFTCESASLPASKLGEVSVNYWGRKIKYAGDRDFADWQVTVINDEDFLVRRGFENWVEAIQGSESNLREISAAGTLYKRSQAQITQFNRNGVPIRIYEFDGIWPSEVGDMAMSWGSTNQISTFRVTLTYDLFRVVL